jgi:2-keto-3-deoxy-L-rhamnonate aldolase RhmA
MNVDSIAATAGVDVLWVGHFDLTQAMGIPGDFRNPAFLEALRQVAAAAQRAGKVAGINPGTMEQAREWMGLGFRAISWSNDAAVYRVGLAAAVAGIREIAGG